MQSSHDDSQSDEPPPKKKKKKPQRNPAKLDPTKLTGEEHVDMIDRVSGKRLPSKLTPTLNNLAEWLARNPAYDVVSEWGSIVKAKVSFKSTIGTKLVKNIFIQPSLYLILFHMIIFIYLHCTLFCFIFLFLCLQLIVIQFHILPSNSWLTID